jgi:hypothetical protein
MQIRIIQEVSSTRYLGDLVAVHQQQQALALALSLSALAVEVLHVLHRFDGPPPGSHPPGMRPASAAGLPGKPVTTTPLVSLSPSWRAICGVRFCRVMPSLIFLGLDLGGLATSSGRWRPP